MKRTRTTPVIAMALSITARAVGGVHPERMIAFSGLPPEGAAQDTQA